MNSNIRKKYWEKVHIEDEYKSVWSATHDPNLLEKINSEIHLSDTNKNILIPGCGSVTFLQESIIKNDDIEKILCVDYPEVIRISQNKISSKKIEFLASDISCMELESEFDIAIHVNSVLSESDLENKNILLSTYESLFSEGKLIGLFPTVFCALDIDITSNSQHFNEQINLKDQLFYEKRQGIWQKFYTPLSLKKILKEAGFSNIHMEIMFFESDISILESNRYYGIQENDLFIYEIFVTALKH